MGLAGFWGRQAGNSRSGNQEGCGPGGKFKVLGCVAVEACLGKGLLGSCPEEEVLELLSEE